MLKRGDFSTEELLPQKKKKKKGPLVKFSLASEIKLGLYRETSSLKTNEIGLHKRQASSLGNKRVLYSAGRLHYFVTLSVCVTNSFALSEEQKSPVDRVLYFFILHRILIL